MVAEKCCYFKLDKGCLCLGAITFVISCCFIISSVICLTLEEDRTASLARPAVGIYLTNHTNHTSHNYHVLNLPWPKPVIEVALGIVLVTCALWMVFSGVLFFGILKGRATWVMSYFLFGVFLSLMLMVSALLELVQNLWPMSVVTLIFTVLYIRCLYSVFTAYDLLRQGRTLDDERPLMLDEEFSVDIE